MGVKHRSDKRATLLMSGSPAVKVGFWVLFNALPFFLPNQAVLSYGYVARVGSAMFLVLQLVLLLDFVLTMNEKWVAAAEEDERHYKAMLFVTVALYVACIVLVGGLLASSFLFMHTGTTCLVPCTHRVRV
jgi:serine incorporator 1/3